MTLVPLHSTVCADAAKTVTLMPLHSTVGECFKAVLIDGPGLERLLCVPDAPTDMVRGVLRGTFSGAMLADTLSTARPSVGVNWSGKS